MRRTVRTVIILAGVSMLTVSGWTTFGLSAQRPPRLQIKVVQQKKPATANKKSNESKPVQNDSAAGQGNQGNRHFRQLPFYPPLGSIKKKLGEIPTFTPHIVVQVSPKLPADVRKTHNEFASLINAMKLVPNDRSVVHFKWLNDKNITHLGWKGFVEDIQQAQRGYVVTLRVTPAFTTGVPSASTDFVIERYLIIDGNARLLEVVESTLPPTFVQF